MDINWVVVMMMVADSSQLMTVCEGPSMYLPKDA
jgi:hypothetical protein